MSTRTVAARPPARLEEGGVVVGIDQVEDLLCRVVGDVVGVGAVLRVHGRHSFRVEVRKNVCGRGWGRGCAGRCWRRGLRCRLMGLGTPCKGQGDHCGQGKSPGHPLSMKKRERRKRHGGDSAHICYRGTSICPLRQSASTTGAPQWVLFTLSSQISPFLL